MVFLEIFVVGLKQKISPKDKSLEIFSFNPSIENIFWKCWFGIFLKFFKKFLVFRHKNKKKNFWRFFIQTWSIENIFRKCWCSDFFSTFSKNSGKFHCFIYSFYLVGLDTLHPIVLFASISFVSRSIVILPRSLEKVTKYVGPRSSGALQNQLRTITSTKN